MTLPEENSKQVYIERTKGLKEEDGAPSLLEMRACSREMNTNVSKDGSQDLSVNTTGGIKMSESVNIDFEKVKSFEDFYIIVDGVVINSELSKRLQHKYYELCCSQKSFLHDNILKGLSFKLVVGTIAETVRMADALRDPKLATFRDEFANWEKILKFFQGMGMNVGFLLNRLEQLMDISSKSKRHKKATLERARAEEEARNLEAKLLEAKKTMNRLEVEIETQGPSTEILELKLQEMAEAPW